MVRPGDLGRDLLPELIKERERESFRVSGERARKRGKGGCKLPKGEKCRYERYEIIKIKTKSN